MLEYKSGESAVSVHNSNCPAMDDSQHTFLIPSGLRCRATSLSGLTTGMVKKMGVFNLGDQKKEGVVGREAGNNVGGQETFIRILFPHGPTKTQPH